MHGFGLGSAFSSFAPSERGTWALVDLQQVSLLKQREKGRLDTFACLGGNATPK